MCSRQMQCMQYPTHKVHRAGPLCSLSSIKTELRLSIARRGENHGIPSNVRRPAANESFLQECLIAAIPSSQERLELMRKVRRSHNHVSEFGPGSNTISISGSQSAFPTETSSSLSSDPSLALEDVADAGRFLADPDGQKRFIGIASGAAFLDQLRQFALTVLPLLSLGHSSDDHHGGYNLLRSQFEDSFTRLVGRYQTHDSRPLSLPYVDPYLLPSYEEARQLLSSLSGFEATHDFTIFYWGDLSRILHQAYNVTTDAMSNPSSITLATLNAALALAAQQSSIATVSKCAEQYYTRANLLLGRPLESATRQHIPCLCLIGCYLMGENRRDGAYSYIRTAGHVAVTYGFHQAYMTEESEKRLFWTVYVLDR
jgi:hypothetical protein